MSDGTAVSDSSAGFRKLTVAKKVRESGTVTSFHLVPERPEEWLPFEPGQFLVFRISGPDGTSVLRNYSVSSSNEERTGYRISVKREGAPAAGLPDGLGSSYLHDEVEVGDVLDAQGPRGGFFLDRSSERPVVLLSGGVGLTPLVSMLHALAATQRRVVFVHACDSGDVHALRDEVERLATSRAQIAVHVCYRFPTEADMVAGRHHSEGVIGRELLRSVLPLDDYDFYLCGPPPFMRGVYEALGSLGVRKERIAYEFFGPATLLDAPSEPLPAPTPVATSPVDPAAGETRVEFRRSGVSAVWNETSESLLSFAEGEGFNPAFSCRAGICGSCRMKLLAGEVDYFEEPLDPPASGEVLLCCAKPRGSIALDL